MPALATPVHRQHIFLFALAFSNQEVAIILQQFLHLQTGDGTVIPALMGQGLLRLGHRRQGGGNLVRCIKYTTLQEEVAHTAMSKEQGGGERGRLILKNTNRILGLEQAAEMAHYYIYVEELMVFITLLQDQTMNNTIA